MGTEAGAGGGIPDTLFDELLRDVLPADGAPTAAILIVEPNGMIKVEAVKRQLRASLWRNWMRRHIEGSEFGRGSSAALADRMQRRLSPAQREALLDALLPSLMLHEPGQLMFFFDCGVRGELLWCHHR